MEKLRERLALEAELLERIDNNRATPGCEEISADLEREIIERELADLALSSEPEPAFALLRRSTHRKSG